MAGSASESCKGTRGPAVPAPALKAPKNMERSCLTPPHSPHPGTQLCSLHLQAEVAAGCCFWGCFWGCFC